MKNGVLHEVVQLDYGDGSSIVIYDIDRFEYEFFDD